MINSTFVHAQNINLGLNVATGYDSNITLTPEPESSFFTEAALNFRLPLNNFSNSPSVDIYSSLDFIKYLDDEQSKNFNLGAALYKYLLKKTFYLTLDAYGNIYRSGIANNNDLNSVAAKGSLDWRLSYKYTFFLKQTVSYESYDNDYKPILHGPRHNRDKSHKGKDPEWLNKINQDYKNILSTTRLGMDVLISPKYETSIYMEHKECESNVDIESFQGNGLGIDFRVYPSPKWELDLYSRADFFRFHKPAKRERRTDTELFGKMILLRSFGQTELYTSVSCRKNISSWEEEEYKSWSGQCGISFAF